MGHLGGLLLYNLISRVFVSLSVLEMAISDHYLTEDLLRVWNLDSVRPCRVYHLSIGCKVIAIIIHVLTEYEWVCILIDIFNPHRDSANPILHETVLILFYILQVPGMVLCSQLANFSQF